MSQFKDKVVSGDFSIESIDTTAIDKWESMLPKSGAFDLNICEQGLVATLEAQNYCQEMIAQVDRWIGIKEQAKNQAWAVAALQRAKDEGLKTAKDREWFANADPDYIRSCKELAIAKTCKKFFENKCSYFSGWHYTFKTFLKRDYGLERLANTQDFGYNDSIPTSHPEGSETKTWDGDNDTPWE